MRTPNHSTQLFLPKILKKSGMSYNSDMKCSLKGIHVCILPILLQLVLDKDDITLECFQQSLSVSCSNLLDVLETSHTLEFHLKQGEFTLETMGITVKCFLSRIFLSCYKGTICLSLEIALSLMGKTGGLSFFSESIRDFLWEERSRRKPFLHFSPASCFIFFGLKRDAPCSLFPLYHFLSYPQSPHPHRDRFSLLLFLLCISFISIIFPNDSKKWIYMYSQRCYLTCVFKL